MTFKTRWFIVATGLFLLPVAGPQALRYEIIPEENTIVSDDSDAIVMAEYLRRVRDSLANEKPRTAAAELRRVAALAGRAADSSSGESRDALKAIQTQALKLAYAAETNSESAARQIRDLAARTENFIEGEWVILEAKQAFTRGDMEAARILLTLAAQQMERRAQRSPKDRGSKVEDVARTIRDFLEEQDALKSGTAGRRIGEFAKAVRGLVPTEAKTSKLAASASSLESSEESSAETSSLGAEESSTANSDESSGLGLSSSKSSGLRFGKSDTSRSGSKQKPSKGKKGGSKPGAPARGSYGSRSSDRESKSLSASETQSDEMKSQDSETSSTEPSDTESLKAQSPDSSTSNSKSSKSPPDSSEP